MTVVRSIVVVAATAAAAVIVVVVVIVTLHYLTGLNEHVFIRLSNRPSVR